MITEIKCKDVRIYSFFAPFPLILFDTDWPGLDADEFDKKGNLWTAMLASFVLALIATAYIDARLAAFLAPPVCVVLMIVRRFVFAVKKLNGKSKDVELRAASFIATLEFWLWW